MFTESDRVNLRHFLGFGSLFAQADPRLENAITAIQSTADGGTRPDSSSETFLKTLVTSAQTLETKMQGLWDLAEVTGREDEATLDPFRGMVMLRSEGRRLVQGMCQLLGMRGPRADIFGGSKVIDDNPFRESPHW